MDVALYEKLLDAVRSDLDESAPKLAEIQSVTTFLERRMETASDADSYQNVLNDLSADIQRENHSVAELERIDRFVSGKLGKPARAASAAVPAPAERPRSQPKPANPAKKEPAPKPPQKNEEDTKDEPGPRLEDLPSDRSGMTIEFGPDGFPINSAPKGKSSKDARKTAVPEGATINFGPDGFPIDVPGSKK